MVEVVTKERRSAQITAKRYKMNVGESTSRGLSAEEIELAIVKSVTMMKSDNESIQSDGIKTLRQLLGTSQRAVQSVIESGVYHTIS